MSAQPAPTPLSQTERPGPAARWARDAQHYQDILLEMADIGADIVRIMHKTLRVQAGEPSIATILSDDFAPLTDMTPPLTNPHNKILQNAANAFDVVTKSMRRSIMLAERLAVGPSTTPPNTTNPIASGDSPSGDSPTRDSAISEGEAHLAPANQNSDNQNSDNQNTDSQNDNERQETQSREAETLQPERADRPDRPDAEFDRAARTFTDLLAEIVRAFGQQHAEWAEDTEDCEDFEETEFPETVSSASMTALTTLPKNVETNTAPSAQQPAPPFPPEPFPRL